MRRVVVVVACVVGVLWLAPVSPAARAAPGPVQAVVGSAASGATGGRSVLADFNADTYADLAVGVRDESVAHSDDGAVNVIYGSAAGLSATTVPDQLWYQGKPDVEGNPEGGDQFGWSLAST